jgi:transposase
MGTLSKSRDTLIVRDFSRHAGRSNVWTIKRHQEAVMRLAEVPGLGVDSAHQIIAEVGVQASTFPSAAELTSWVGTCPGKDESAEENHSSRCAKGNKYLRRVLNQAAHAAVKKNGSHFQAVFRRLLPRLGYQSAIWAIAHRLCLAAWFGRSCMRGCDLSSKAANLIPRPSSNAPGC